MFAIVAFQPVLLDENVGERAVFARGPERAAVHKLLHIDQAALQRDHAKQQVVVGIRGRHSNFQGESPPTRIER